MTEQAIAEFKALQESDPVTASYLNKASELLFKVQQYIDPDGYEYELYLRDLKEVEIFFLKHYPNTEEFIKELNRTKFPDRRSRNAQFEDMSKFREENPERAKRLANSIPLEVNDMTTLEERVQDPVSTRDMHTDFETELHNIKPNPDDAQLFKVTILAKNGTPYTLDVKIRGFKPDKGVIEVTSYMNGNRAFRNFNVANVINAEVI